MFRVKLKCGIHFYIGFYITEDNTAPIHNIPQEKEDEVKEKRLREVYATYMYRPDFVHMAATLAATIKNGDTILGNMAGLLGAGLPIKDAAGYGGDIYGVFGADPSMNRGDYLSDLDSVNLFAMRGENTNLPEVMTPYYTSIFTESLNRADEFAKNMGNGSIDAGLKYLKDQYNLKQKSEDNKLFFKKDLKIAENFINHIENSALVWTE